MESLEVTGKTVQEAIEKALSRLGLTRDQVDISVLSEGSRGILGFGGEDARILVSPKPSVTPASTNGTTVSTRDIAQIGREILLNLLDGMGVDADVEIRSVEPTIPHEGFAAVLDVSNGDLGMLIGRRGETLGALQFITNMILQRRTRRFVRVQVDVQAYRVRREQTLRGLAERIAARVAESGEPFTLEAMPAYERRIVHLALASHPTVTTISVGEGDHRRVMITPRK